MYTYLSNQTFAGGFDVGMVQAGFKLVHKTEMKGAFGTANCLANRHILGQDWTHEAGDPSAWHAPYADVVVSNPPCSGWSVMSSKKFRGANSPALSCTWAFAEYVTRAQPQVAVFESVQQAFTHPDGIQTMRALHRYVEEKTGLAWHLYHVRHNAYSVGGCAQRRRYFWLISRVPFGIEVPRPTTLPVLNDVIGDLAPLPLTWQAQPYRAPAHPWVRQLLSPTGTVDGHIGIRNPAVDRISDLLRATEWLPGESIERPTRRHYEQYGRLPDSWQHSEHKIVSNDFRMGYTTPTRWNGENHARVITGGSLQLVVHPYLDRMITHREAARVLGFPDNWNILPLRGTGGLHLTWGKGISTHCGRWIGDWIRRALDGEPGTFVGKPIGDRENDIDVTHSWRLGRDQLNIRIPVVVQ